MADELVFTVKQGLARPAARVSMASVGLKERTHLQEWVLAHPQILGSDAKIVAFELSRWQAATGQLPADRLDILALDRTGRLIVAELKRDKAPDTVTMQAINYAAMVSRFSLDSLADEYARHLGGEISPQQARQELQEWAEDLSDETLGPPQIVLLASEFGPTVTNTALFLFEAGIDIRLRRYQLYRTEGDEILLSVSQLLPVPAAEDFMVKPRSSSATQADTRDRRERRAMTPARLIANRAIPDRTLLQIVVPDNYQDNRVAIEEWLAAEPSRGQVEWRLDPQLPVLWLHERRPYTMAGLVRTIITLATGVAPSSKVGGPNWLRDGEGRTLQKIAESLPA